MSEIGYNGRAFYIEKDGVKIAAVQSKSATYNREPVDVTNDDSESNRTVLPTPSSRGVDVSVEGVLTENNQRLFMEEWNGNVLTDVALVHADGTRTEAEFGFFLGNLDFSGPHDGHVSFTAQLLSSGPVTNIYPSVVV